ncbi:MAG: hypothetical protein ACR2MY_02135 [Candidatus Dormibacteria bacterium]
MLSLVVIGGASMMPAVAPAGAAAAPSTWLAGAAAVSITPPPYNPADDARDFPGCDTTVFSGKRLFDFEEPYIDSAGTGQFDYTKDLYCDADHNGRWDGLYSSGGVDHLTEWVHDPIYARALAISDGARTVVIESITAQGLLLEDDQRIRNGIRAAQPLVSQVYVSSTHNESSPDPIGIYGAPDNGTGSAGVHSGVDDYYISFLVQQAEAAGKQAVGVMVAAKIRVGEFYPADVRARLSETFLTTDAIRSPAPGQPAFGTPEATDGKARVLQLVRADGGGNIETLFNWAAHNQQVGHAPDQAQAPDPNDGNRLKRVNRAISDDWPGVFAGALASRLGGQAMFLVGDNGSIEDPHAFPLPNPDNECPAAGFTDHVPRAEGCFDLPAHTGARIAADVASALSGNLDDVAPHAINARVDTFAVPLQNQLFVAAFGAGLFAHRTVASVTPCLDSSNVPRTCFLTEVGLLDLGPQLQMLVNPGEAYPALIEGHPFGIEQISCPGRTQPPVPAWHAAAAHKLEMGLGDDLVGYEIPSPGWFSDPAVYVDPGCPAGARAQSDPTADYDQHNQYHKLESESLGPDAAGLVAQHLAALGDTLGGPGGQIMAGRFLMPSGAFTRKGADGPVGIWVLPAGVTDFAPGVGTVVALPGIQAFGSMPVGAHGQFIDFDGRVQSAPSIDTRGMRVSGVAGTTYFVDVYPQLAGAAPGPATLAVKANATAPPNSNAQSRSSLPATGTAMPRGGGWLLLVLLGAACLLIGRVAYVMVF